MEPKLGEYIFNFNGHGAWSPDGKVEMTDEQIEAHNSRVQAMEMEAMKQTGRAVLYLFSDAKGLSVGTWASKDFQRTPVIRSRQSSNNWGAQRTDVWFFATGSKWHGVNLGDNDIVRCKRIKA